MENTLAMDVSVKQDGNDIPIGKMGYLQELRGGRAIVTVVVKADDPAYDFYAISVDGQKKISPKKDIAADVDSSHKVFKMKVNVESRIISIGNGVGPGGDGKELFTSYPGNNFRLIKIFSNGQVEVYEIALIAQDDRCYLTTQTYTAKCYENINNAFFFCCPLFDTKWPAMISFLQNAFTKSFGKDFANEFPFPDPREQSEEKNTPLQPNTGIVLWFNYAMGIGAVETDHGTTRVHWSKIPKREAGLAHLNPGEKIGYAGIGKIDHGNKNTSFEKAISGVVLLQ